MFALITSTDRLMYSRILIKFGKGQALIYTNQTELQAFFLQRIVEFLRINKKPEH